MLGRAGAAAVPEGAPVYSLDWYAPALGYYADRDWHLLSSSARVAEYLQGVYLFRLAGNIHEVPPWPAPPFVVAGDRERLAAAGFDTADPIAASGPFLLVEARAR